MLEKPDRWYQVMDQKEYEDFFADLVGLFRRTYANSQPRRLFGDGRGALWRLLAEKNVSLDDGRRVCLHIVLVPNGDTVEGKQLLDDGSEHRFSFDADETLQLVAASVP